jgi:CRISPR-associated protein Csm3
MKKIGYHEITGRIELLSGLRIGGSDDLLQIGGADLTCIRNPVTQAPYLPGSSLKGKMRSELESLLGRFGGQRGNEPCGCGDCIVCAVFGMHKPREHKLGPSRIIVRDAQLIDGGQIENKSSTAIDRATGTALRGALRSEQRVVPGTTFSLKIGIQIWDIDEKAEHTNLIKVSRSGELALVAFVFDGLKLVERTGLGSGVSKGSGELRFLDLKLDGQPVPEGFW